MQISNNLYCAEITGRINFLRATNYKHYRSEDNALNTHTSKTSECKKISKKAKKISLGVAIAAIATVLIVPTTTLAPDVGAYEDSRIASYSVGDIDKFSAVITNNCVEITTAPETQQPTTEEITEKQTEAEATEASTEPSEDKTEYETNKEASNSEEPAESNSEKSYSYDYNADSSYDSYSNDSSSYLMSISNADPNYSPKHVNLSSYDRDKLERIVMGEAGTMSYNGCALVAQSIRDAMNRSNTNSVDRIISEYQYFGVTSYEPNQKVKDAVSYIFDQDGSAVQHRVLCFYTGYSPWHETQTFIMDIDNVRFFDFVNA